MKKILVFASGTGDGGGSGFERLVEDSRIGVLDAQIVAVVSNYPHGGVLQRADRLEILSEYFPKPHEAEGYRALAHKYRPDLIVLAGWLKRVVGVGDCLAVNIHPGPLSKDPAKHFGGPGMHGMHVHEAVLKAVREGRITHSAVGIHFVNADYDAGDVICQCPVLVDPDDTPETLQRRVNTVEHWCYGRVIDLVLMGATTVSLEDLGQPPAEIAGLIYIPAA